MIGFGESSQVVMSVLFKFIQYLVFYWQKYKLSHYHDASSDIQKKWNVSAMSFSVSLCPQRTLGTSMVFHGLPDPRRLRPHKKISSLSFFWSKIEWGRKCSFDDFESKISFGNIKQIKNILMRAGMINNLFAGEGLEATCGQCHARLRLALYHVYSLNNTSAPCSARSDNASGGMTIYSRSMWNRQTPFYTTTTSKWQAQNPTRQNRP
jgi:hypothetical protein